LVPVLLVALNSLRSWPSSCKLNISLKNYGCLKQYSNGIVMAEFCFHFLHNKYLTQQVSYLLSLS
jgi:hypothetical protein